MKLKTAVEVDGIRSGYAWLDYDNPYDAIGTECEVEVADENGPYYKINGVITDVLE